MSSFPRELPPVISAEQAVAATTRYAQLICVKRCLFWLETDARSGLTELYRLVLDNPLAEPERISPLGVSIGTRVHEYGGASYCVCETLQCVVYVEQKTQQLWCLDLGTLDSEQLTFDNKCRYGAPIFDRHRDQVIVIEEAHYDAHEHPMHRLVAIHLTCCRKHLIHEGFDFYDQAALSPDGLELTWVSWNHPDQPWVASQLCALQLDDVSKGLSWRLASPQQALTQPVYDDSGALFVISDVDGWWAVYPVVHGKLAEPLYRIDESCFDVCAAPWQVGQVSYVQWGDGWLLSGHQQGWGKLSVLPVESCGQMNRLQFEDNEFSLFRSLCVGKVGDKLKAFGIASHPEQVDQLVILSRQSDGQLDITPLFPKLTADQIVRPKSDVASVMVRAQGSLLFAQGFLWQNAGYMAKTASHLGRSLIVSIHGGPTAAAYPVYNSVREFWLTRGFAYLDVNHRGSTGFGRNFRNSLQGQWGRYDVEDTLALVQQVLDQYHFDNVFIRGSSAGGLTVLNSLAASHLFSAGVSLYGVTDLMQLDQCTHKFESEYVSWLVKHEKGTFEQACRARSPINKVKDITTPVLFIQGELDRVVPKTQTDSMYRELQRADVDVRVLYFSNEYHGFRLPHNQQQALRAEQQFYADVMRSDQ